MNPHKVLSKNVLLQCDLFRYTVNKNENKENMQIPIFLRNVDLVLVWIKSGIIMVILKGEGAAEK